MAMGTVLMTSQSQTHVEEGLQNFCCCAICVDRFFSIVRAHFVA
jgi:hypothetical protein